MSITSTLEPVKTQVRTPFWVKAWEQLGKPPADNRVPGSVIIMLIAGAIGIIVAVVVWQQDGFLMYGDAQSHLTIARRVIDSKDSGFPQLGTVWLPFPHILLIPLVSSFALWQTGWAGAIIGIGCLMISSVALWRIAARVGFPRAAKIITVSVFLLNPSILYLHTTALTEPVLIATILAATSGLAGWITAKPAISPGELAVFAGAPTAAAVLSRYEGWAFMILASGFILFASWRRWKSISYTTTLTLSYLATPVVAILWWVSYNWVRFQDPLSFMRGPYSAAAQQGELETLGLLPTKGNFGMVFWTYNWTVIDIIGIPMLIIAGIGAFILLWTRHTDTTALLIWMLGFIYPFALLTMFIGQTVIRNEHTLPAGYFNLRYAACLMPLVALLCGVIVDYAQKKGNLLKGISVAVILLTAVGYFTYSVTWAQLRMPIIKEGMANQTSSFDTGSAADWLGTHYEGGNILMDEGANPVLMRMSLPLDQIYATFSGQAYLNALADPSRYTTWVYVDTKNLKDRVWAQLKDNPSFTTRFVPVYQSGSVNVYKNINPAGIRS